MESGYNERKEQELHSSVLASVMNLTINYFHISQPRHANGYLCENAQSKETFFEA